MKIVRIFVQEGRYLHKKQTFESKQSADDYSDGYCAAAGEFGSSVCAYDPCDPDSVTEFFEEKEEGDSDGNSGKTWRSIFDSAKAEALAD